jgi:uncharacterized glyoxalase superfamily protein PhnB
MNNKNKIKDKFWGNLLTQITDEDRAKWQLFISEQGYSSHMFVVCERPKL